MRKRGTGREGGVEGEGMKVGFLGELLGRRWGGRGGEGR